MMMGWWQRICVYNVSVCYCNFGRAPPGAALRPACWFVTVGCCCQAVVFATSLACYCDLFLVLSAQHQVATVKHFTCVLHHECKEARETDNHTVILPWGTAGPLKSLKWSQGWDSKPDDCDLGGGPPGWPHWASKRHARSPFIICDGSVLATSASRHCCWWMRPALCQTGASWIRRSCSSRYRCGCSQGW